MTVSPELLAAMAERMNRLGFVRWDRCVVHDGAAASYGWIDRDDGRADFVVLSFQWGTTTGLDGKAVEYFGVGYTTSSAKHSPEIPGLLYGDDAEHNECQRVQNVFGDLVRQVIDVPSARPTKLSRRKASDR